MNKAKSENVLLAKATQKIGWDLHSFSGIFIGLLLFVFFYGGAFSLFLHDLHQWERPAERIAFEGAPASTDALLAPLWARYDFTGQNLSVGMPTARHPVLSTYVRDEDKTVSVDPHTLDFVAEQESVPGDLLYGLHFLNIVHTHEPGPVYFLMWGTASIVSLIGLVAILTGLLIYLPRIKLDIFRFRLRTPGRRRWLDAHNVIGTMSLPFALILSFTGAIICVAHVLFLVFMPAMGGPPGPEAAEGFGGGMEPNVATMMAIDPAATVSLASAPETETKLLDEAPIGTVRYPSVDAMVARVHERWPAIPIRELTIHNVGSSTSVVSITADDEISVIAGASNMGAAKMYFRADTGELLETVGPDAPYSVTSSVWQFIINLHFATFGGPLLKPLYFVLALSFGFAILAGNVVWTRSRRGVHPERRAFYDRVDR
ncbi:MAG: PepSY-associated TM helix domain-containing protein, partial [Pseudomonadota bacterium]